MCLQDENCKVTHPAGQAQYLKVFVPCISNDIPQDEKC